MITRTSHRRVAALIGGIMALFLIGSAFAQGGDDVYRLAAGEVYDDDLYITANEVYIEGTVRGDLIASGAYVEVSGTVEGDMNAAGAYVAISGTVQDDVRVAGAGVQVTGQVGDDIYAAAGGGPGGGPVVNSGSPQVPAGIEIADSTTIGGSANLFGGEVRMNGAVDGDLTIAAAIARLNGTVAKNADITANDYTFGPDARVDGSLKYTAESELTIPPNIGGNIIFDQQTPTQPESPLMRTFWAFWRAALMLLGLVLVGLLIFRFKPQAITYPSEAISNRPGRVTLYGLAAALLLIFLPILSALLVFAMILFWGWFPGIALLFFLFAGLTMIWYMSPLVSGLWLGRLLLHQMGREASPIADLSLGAAIILLAGLIPMLGWLVMLCSFVLALGGILLGLRGEYEAPPATFEQHAAVPG